MLLSTLDIGIYKVGLRSNADIDIDEIGMLYVADIGLYENIWLSYIFIL